MQVGTRNKGLKKAIEDEQEANKRYGVPMSKQLRKRVGALNGAESLADFWPPNSGPERCHELKGDMAGTFSMDLNQPYRLLFKEGEGSGSTGEKNAQDNADEKERWKNIRAVELLEIRDTHG